MQIKTVSIVTGVLALFTNTACADWGIKKPWDEEGQTEPAIQPYQLPTLNGNTNDFKSNIPALKDAPKVSPDLIFKAVLHCYPEKSKFNIDINLVAGMRSQLDEYDTGSWPTISDHYVGIVGKMPLYSSTELSRERQWEYQRRTATATAVAQFTEALASRNYAYRLIGLYLSLEARAQKRVEKGVANVNEQIGYLEKVAATHRDLLAHETKIVEQRLALVAMCDDHNAQNLDDYLKNITKLPKAKSVKQIAPPSLEHAQITPDDWERP